MSETDASAKVSTERQSLGSDGHMSATLYMREDTQFRVVYDPDTSHMDGQIALYVNSFGGAVSLVITEEQWRAISEAVESVLPKAVV